MGPGRFYHQSGIRAMGILEKNISTPLMQLVESDLMVMDTDMYYTRLLDTDMYYTRLLDKITEWMDDDGSAVLFEDFPPCKDEEYAALYLPVTDHIEQLTETALSIMLSNMQVCCKRQLHDHLPGVSSIKLAKT